MAGIVVEEVEEYALEHTTAPSELLRSVEEQTREKFEPRARMMVGALEGRFLELLVYAMQARRILEIGAFTGYSSLSMAAGMPADGKITTCELDRQHAETAKRHIAESPYADRIELRLGPALATLATLPGPFDFVFIDADKVSYVEYYEATLPKLAPTGLIAADNTLWSGQVVDLSDDSDDTLAIRTFNNHVWHDPRVVCVQLTIRDGVTLIRRAGAPPATGAAGG
jgi:caffeoyl-CoA O-methyltransferase